MKILIVEDEGTCSKALANFCKKFEIECDIADDGIPAVEFCKKGTQYDFILMDMFMPNLDGDKATEQIRAMDHGKAYVIILLTGLDEMDEDTAKGKGFDTFYKKPLKKSDFEQIVNKYKK